MKTESRKWWPLAILALGLFLFLALFAPSGLRADTSPNLIANPGFELGVKLGIREAHPVERALSGILVIGVKQRLQQRGSVAQMV